MKTMKSTSHIEKLAAGIAKKAVQDAVKAITEKTREAYPIPTATENTTHNTATEPEHAYIFFNCDTEKTPSSMNIRFNDEAYSDTPYGRRALLKKIETEIATTSIRVSNMDTAKEAILNGDPTKANELMEYGCIELLTMS